MLPTLPLRCWDLPKQQRHRTQALLAGVAGEGTHVPLQGLLAGGLGAAQLLQGALLDEGGRVLREAGPAEVVLAVRAMHVRSACIPVTLLGKCLQTLSACLRVFPVSLSRSQS